MTPLIITSGNPLAPRWMQNSSCPEETPPGFRDQFFQYPMTFTVGTAVFAQNLFIVLDFDADFVLRQIESNNVVFRFKDSYGHSLSADLVTSEVYGPIWPELVLPRGSRFFVDVDNTQGVAPVTAAFILRGAKRFKL